MSEKWAAHGVSIEYDTEADTYRVMFDSTKIDPSVVVVMAMAQITGTGPLELDPLHNTVDVEALDQLCTQSLGEQNENPLSITFQYLGYEVTVKSYGVVDIDPLTDEAG